jgi:hypothetical protein
MTTQTSDLQVAQTIIAQMGGTRRLSMMVGASLFAGDDSSVMFSFKGSRKVNKCRVTLDASDTYTVEFFKFSPSKLTCPVVDEISGVDAEMLVDIFESCTGLYLSF